MSNNIVLEQVVPFHGCGFLVPVWNKEHGYWHFACCISPEKRCPKYIKKKSPSKECFTEEYPTGYKNEYDHATS